MRFLVLIVISVWANLSFAAGECGGPLGLLQGPGTVQSRSISFNGASRSYSYFTPRAVPDNSPLIVLLHPYGSTGTLFSNYVDIPQIGHEKCAIVIAPSGRSLAWNAGNVNTGSNADDVNFIMAAIADYKSRNLNKVDSDRQYLMGMSNGGSMAYRMACERSASFAGMVIVAGALPRDVEGRIKTEPGFDPAYACDNAADPSKPSHPIPLFVIHGKEDACLNFNGGPLAAPNADVLIPSVNKVATEWAGFNGCPVTEIAAGTLTLTLQTSRPSLGELSCREISGCSNGSNVKVCNIERGGHRWPGASALTSFVTCGGDGGLASKSDFFATREAFEYLLTNNFRLSQLLN